MLDPFILILVFAGGIVSFISPCNASTLPVFVSFIQNQATNAKRALLLSFAFSLGFIFMFTIIASLFILISGFIGYMFWLRLIAGLIIIGMGFYLFFAKGSYEQLPVSHPISDSDPDLNAEEIREMGAEEKEYEGIMGAMILGFSMGSPWIACITPIYLTIVSIAMVQQTFILGMALFSLYAVGLMLPYIIIGAVLGRINQRFIVKLIKIGSKIQKIFAIILIWIGIEFFLSALGFGGLIPYI